MDKGERVKTPSAELAQVICEAQEVLAEARRWKSVFGEAETAELVELCITQLSALREKYRYLAHAAERLPEKKG